MSKRTPGPWVTFNYGGNTGDGEFEGLGVCQQGKSVAVMMGDPNGYVCDCPPSKYQEANARLIAAAPDLLEALEVIAADSRWISGEPTLLQARAAIAKAKGDA